MASLTRTLTRAVALLAASLVVATGFVALGPTAPAHASATEIYNLANDARVKAGLPRLARNSAMDKVAQDWTNYMASTGTLAHNPNYSRQIPSGWSAAGENVGWAWSAVQLHNAWMDSSGHRANILSKSYNSIGVGWTVDSKGRMWSTQVFATYKGVTAPSTSTTSGAPYRLSDPSGDRRADVLARRSDGSLWIYPGNGSGSFLSSRQIGHGWQGMTALASPGDVTGDGNTDVWARDGSGRLWLYPGNGKGGFLSARQVGSGWNGMNLLITPGDFTGDGRNDLLARGSDGRMWLYPGNGKGGFGSGRAIGNGWQGMTSIVGAGDITGDRAADVVARDSSGRLWVYPGNGKGSWKTRFQAGSGWNVMTDIVNVGDFNGDAKADVIARNSSGRLYLYPGTGRGTFGTARQIGSGWTVMNALF